MKKFRVVFRCLFSCVAALVTVLLTGSGESGEYIPPSQSFAVVECPVSVSDRAVADALRESGLHGIASESTQFFFLNAWSEVEQVPLDRLEERLIGADPRRDPYAQKLRSFFVNDTARRFFVPLSNWKNKSVFMIESDIRAALPKVPVSSIIIPQSAQPPFSRMMSIIEKTAVLAALLMVYIVIVMPFFKDFLSDRPYHSRKIRRSKIPFGVFLFLTVIFIASGIAGSAASAFRIVFGALPLACFLCGGVFPAWFRWMAAQRRGHILFRPVALNGVRSRPVRRGPPKIIVGLFAVAAITCAAAFFTGSNESGTARLPAGDYGAIVSEDEYRSHGQRQALFSYVPLGIGENAPPYRHYTEDADGLYVAAGTVAEAETVIPPYPFASLAVFVEGAEQSLSAPAGGPVLFFIALAALLPFAILRVRDENV
jgi:hypothetical protein